VAASPVPVEYIGLTGQELPLDAASVDHVLTTWTLCTIPDVERALSEVRRVLRPGGSLHFVEHGRSPDPRVARWQDRLTPLQRRLAGGCHLNRPIGRLVADSGLGLTRDGQLLRQGPEAVRVHVRGNSHQGMSSQRRPGRPRTDRAHRTPPLPGTPRNTDRLRMLVGT
jgi:SAM-dependent methyltransferase